MDQTGVGGVDQLDEDCLIAIPQDAGPVDTAATPGGHYLYVQTGANGVVDSFRVGSGGSLTAIASPITVAAGAGGEGIVAS